MSAWIRELQRGRREQRREAEERNDRRVEGKKARTEVRKTELGPK